MATGILAISSLNLGISAGSGCKWINVSYKSKVKIGSGNSIISYYLLSWCTSEKHTSQEKF